MKKILLIAGCFALYAFSSLPAAEPEGTGEKKLQEQTNKLTVRLLLNDLHNGFTQEALDSCKARIRKEMQQNPKENLRTSVAKKHAVAWVADELQTQYRKSAEQILSSFNGTFTPDEKEKLLSGDKAFFEQQTKQISDPAFQQVRTELIREQKTQVFRKIYPSAEELESMPDAKLNSLLTERFQKGLAVPLWEENEKLIEKELIQPVIAAGRQQQKMQLGIIRRITVPETIWDAPATEKHLEEELNRNIVKEIPDPNARYAVFPATRKQIGYRAEHLPEERVIAALPASIRSEKYLAMLKKEPQKHITPENSFQKLKPELEQGLKETAIRQAHVPEAMKTGLMKNPAIQAAAEERFREICKTMLTNVRQEYAKQQLAQCWRELAEGTWVPAMTETEKYAASGSAKLPLIRKKPTSKNLLKETEALMEKAMRSALAKEVIRLERQKTAVNTVYQSVLTSMEQEQRTRNAQENNWFLSLFSASSGIQLDEIVKAYQKKVIEASSKPLFPQTVSEIEVRARAILQRLQQPPEQKKPEKQSPNRKTVVYIIKITGNDEKITITSGNWSRSFSTGKQAGTELAAEIRTRMKNIKEPSDFQIHLLVNEGKIYYKTVSDLRESLKTDLQECSVEDSLQK